MMISGNTLQYWFDQSRTAAALFDAQHRLLQMNEAFREMFNLKDAHISSLTLWQIVGNESNRKIPDHSVNLKQGKQVTAEIAHLPAFKLKLLPSGQDENQLILALVEQSDNEEKAALSRKLEEALENNRLKTIFLANMSHEIRTPLNTIIGFSELILEEELNKQEILNLVEMINTSGKSLLQLIEDIIDISRIEAGQIRINKSDIQIQPLMKELLQTFGNEIKKRPDKSGVELRTGSMISEGACVFADIYRLRQILMNLLTNAIKFTQTGFIEFGYLAGEPGMVQFYVKDTGVGIDPLMADKVFQRFGQISQPGISNREGLGLGLSITKQLVDLMGGKIWFDSQPGRGTTFYFTLPACKESNLAGGSYPGEIFGWSDKIFLIVDDVEANYLFFNSLLKKTGALLLWARNGDEAIRYCRSNPDISLVLMDIQMPLTDGYEATRKIKELSPNLPIIAQTAFADKESKTKALQSGCDDFISKPINKNELLALIKQYIK